jgi:hypothetical protein
MIHAKLLEKNIKIKMFDISVRTLCDIRHIPYFKKNLILLGILNCNEFSFKSEGGVLKMSKSDMTVMKGQTLLGNIYKLLGITVVGGVVIVEYESNNTVLWHMQLSHMGEREMMEIHMKNLLKGIKICKLGFCRYCVLGK